MYILLYTHCCIQIATQIPDNKVEIGVTSAAGIHQTLSPSSPHWAQPDDSLTHGGTPLSVASSSGGTGGGMSPVIGISSKSRQHVHRPSDLSTVTSMVSQASYV